MILSKHGERKKAQRVSIRCGCSNMRIVRVHGPLPSDMALAAVNAATTVPEMRAAIENPLLGLNLTEYNRLSEAVKNDVVQQLLNNRPASGYPSVARIQAALNQAINQVISLAVVNAATTVPEMRAAIENPLLGLNLTEYNRLSEAAKNDVIQQLLNNRPASGYPSVASVQVSLNQAVNQVVDFDHIYVQAGAVGGNGSRANPFGTIPQGIAAVNPGGTVHILSGTYPITSQIVVNKAGITLKGQPGTLLLLQADIIAMRITAPNTTIDGLTMTSDIPYQKEFIQIGGNNTTIINNTIYGPPQSSPMSDWIVNRAVVSQGGLAISVMNNTFYSLRTGMYINPNVTGSINNNVVYNTKGGFLVDRAFTTFLGNSWGTPPNEFDIVLLVGTTSGPPYDNLALLSALNNNATISDQR
ncbi:MULTISPECIES: hypothetical protein [Geobacillus]|jgi:hypothetical protein|nr:MULTISPECIES: hypothetical protein [Geobacillus]ATO37966.1 hypothetical protein GTID1_12630 [Geobacillus thermodenitrificans]MED0663024.1 hypothetical protein [Geobacillus thermodenitrificans]MED3904567.1 hypothetical protein [Geobacillus thermodenitrificans]NNU86561.1 hypothetical protein [Geobacillus sp. MR]OQP09083.1 hypothetical protein B1691_12165 [Geobacillus sp. 47C-IIb]